VQLTQPLAVLHRSSCVPAHANRTGVGPRPVMPALSSVSGVGTPSKLPVTPCPPGGPGTRSTSRRGVESCRNALKQRNRFSFRHTHAIRRQQRDRVLELRNQAAGVRPENFTAVALRGCNHREPLSPTEFGGAGRPCLQAERPRLKVDRRPVRAFGRLNQAAVATGIAPHRTRASHGQAFTPQSKDQAS